MESVAEAFLPPQRQGDRNVSPTVAIDGPTIANALAIIAIVFAQIANAAAKIAIEALEMANEAPKIAIGRAEIAIDATSIAMAVAKMESHRPANGASADRGFR